MSLMTQESNNLSTYLDPMNHSRSNFSPIKVSSSPQAVTDLENELGFCVQGYMPGTSVVPERLKIPQKKLRSYLNWALKIHSRG